jgi:hypothetical protein
VPAPPTLQPANLPAWLQPMAWAAGLLAVAALVTALMAMRRPRAPKPL